MQTLILPNKQILSSEVLVFIEQKTRLSPKLDIVFKAIFGKHEGLLKALIADLLGFDVNKMTCVEVKNCELIPDYFDQKFSRIDLNVEINHEKYDIEIQVKRSESYRDRALFYWSKLFTQGLKQGCDYCEIQKTITINLLDFTLFYDRKSYHAHIVPMFSDTNVLYSDKMSIHFFELTKVDCKTAASDRCGLWLQFLNAKTDEEFQMLRDQNIDTLNKSIDLLDEISGDESMRYAAFKREIALHDETTYMNEAIRKGIAIGEAKGEAKGEARGLSLATKAIARKMISRDCSYEDISDFTGLTFDEIKALESGSGQETI